MLRPEVQPARLSEGWKFVTTLLTAFACIVVPFVTANETAKYFERRDAAARAREYSQLAYTLSWAREVAWAGAYIQDRYTPADFHTYSGNIDYYYPSSTNRALYTVTGSSGDVSINGTTTITGDLIVIGKIIQK